MNGTSRSHTQRSEDEPWETISDTIRILHVDDDVDFADLASVYLQRANDAFEVVTKTSVEAGLRQLAENDIDCVVSDYEMPGKNGLDFLESVRETYPDLPFILFTGKGSEEIASDAISAGVTDYLQKEMGTDQYTVLANRIENVIDKHEAEELVYRSFRAMDSSREGIAFVDERGTFLYVNRAYTDIVGYDRDELFGESWERVYPDEQVERIHDDILTSVPEQGRWTGDTVYQRKDGSRIVVNHTLSYSEEGTIICLIRDVSNTEIQQQVLREQRQRFDLFIDAVEEYAIFMLDTDGYITSWNTGAERLKGYTEDEILGTHFSVFYTDTQREEGLPGRLLERALEEGSVEHRGSRVHKDGTTFRANVVITAVYDEDDTHRGFGKVTRILTENGE